MLSLEEDINIISFQDLEAVYWLWYVMRVVIEGLCSLCKSDIENFTFSWYVRIWIILDPNILHSLDTPILLLIYIVMKFYK